MYHMKCVVECTYDDLLLVDTVLVILASLLQS